MRTAGAQAVPSDFRLALLDPSQSGFQNGLDDQQIELLVDIERLCARHLEGQRFIRQELAVRLQPAHLGQRGRAVRHKDFRQKLAIEERSVGLEDGPQALVMREGAHPVRRLSVSVTDTHILACLSKAMQPSRSSAVRSGGVGCRTAT